MHALCDELARLPVRHALIILDGCFGMTIHWSRLRDALLVARMRYREEYDGYVHRPAWQVLMSTSHDEMLVDATEGARATDGDGHSLFARALLDGLAGAADRGGDHLITAEDLAMYIRERLALARQRTGSAGAPLLFSLNRHGGGQFVFPRAEWRAEAPACPPCDPACQSIPRPASVRDQDAAWFFGRQAVTRRLVAQVTRHPFTVVVGASGAGKSSLVHAGLAPAVFARGWTVLPTLRPGKAPLEMLHRWARTVDDLSREARPTSWRAWLARLAATSPERPRLMIGDQFEEVLVDQTGALHRSQFLDALVTALDTVPGLHVVITVRSDAELAFRVPALAPRWGFCTVRHPGADPR